MVARRPGPPAAGQPGQPPPESGRSGRRTRSLPATVDRLGGMDPGRTLRPPTRWPRQSGPSCRPSSGSSSSRGRPGPRAVALAARPRPAPADRHRPRRDPGRADRPGRRQRLAGRAPGFSGWVTTGPSDVAAAADLAQAVAVPQRWWTTAGNFVDDLAMRWLIELLGFPASSVGTFTSGGSTANLVGIGAARQHAGERLGLRPSLDGIDGMVEPRVYASTETHHVVGRALGVLGMGRRNLRSIPLDAGGTIDLDLLQAALDEDLAAGRTQVASWAARATSTRVGSIPWPSWPGSPTSGASGCTSTARTADSGCSTTGSARDTATWRPTTRSRSIPTSGWPPRRHRRRDRAGRGHPRPGIHDRDWRLRPRTAARIGNRRARISARRSTSSASGRRTGASISRRRHAAWRSGRSCARSAPKGCAERVVPPR